MTLIISLIDLERSTFNFNYPFKIKKYFQATKKSVLNVQDPRSGLMRRVQSIHRSEARRAKRGMLISEGHHRCFI